MQQANRWPEGNQTHWQNAAYGTRWHTANTESDDTRRAQQFIQADDLIVRNCIHNAFVSRQSVYGRVKNLLNVNYEAVCGPPEHRQPDPLGL
jgi:ABC-type transport system substrate-binding protein